MIGKYQIIEERPGREYVVYYKDFGEQCRTGRLCDAILYALQDWGVETIQEYRST